MIFSNPASGAAASAGAYVRALLEVLGERDPLEVLAELDAWLDRRFSGVPDGVTTAPPKGDDGSENPPAGRGAM